MGLVVEIFIATLVQIDLCCIIRQNLTYDIRFYIENVKTLLLKNNTLSSTSGRKSQVNKGERTILFVQVALAEKLHKKDLK